MIPWWAMACLGITNPNFQAWLFTILIQCIWECNQFCFEVPEWARLQKLEPGFISFKHKHSHLVWRLCLKMFYVDHKSKFSSKNFDPSFMPHVTSLSLWTNALTWVPAGIRESHCCSPVTQSIIYSIMKQDQVQIPRLSSDVSQPVTKHCHLQIFHVACQFKWQLRFNVSNYMTPQQNIWHCSVVTPINQSGIEMSISARNNTHDPVLTRPVT